jgi:azurin
MKKSLVIILCVVMASCSSNKTSDKKEAADTASAPSSNLMTEAPPYDASRIESDAPIVQLTIRARGNTMTEMNFDQAELRIKAGTTVMLTLINESKDASMLHNFVLIESGSAAKVAAEGLKEGADNNFTPRIKEMLVSTVMTKPGETDAITFPAPEPGEYEFICTYPGHYTKMRGKFIVEPKAS